MDCVHHQLCRLLHHRLWKLLAETGTCLSPQPVLGRGPDPSYRSFRQMFTENLLYALAGVTGNKLDKEYPFTSMSTDRKSFAIREKELLRKGAVLFCTPFVCVCVCSHPTICSLIFFFFGEVRGKKEREKKIYVRDRYQLVASFMCPNWGSV